MLYHSLLLIVYYHPSLFSTIILFPIMAIIVSDVILDDSNYNILSPLM